MAKKSHPGDAKDDRSSTWADRSATQADNPVKRWLGRARESRLQEKHRSHRLRHLFARPAT